MSRDLRLKAISIDAPSCKCDIIDVFGTKPYLGNPVAVIHVPHSIEASCMQRVTHWLNHSETVFICEPTDGRADYCARIFGPEGELSFAGHPTLGACHSWLEAGGKPRDRQAIVQQCGIGLVPICQTKAGLALTAPHLLRFERPRDDELQDAIQLLQLDAKHVLDASWVDNGPGWIALLLDHPKSVLAVQPCAKATRHVSIGIAAQYPSTDTYEVRAFFTDRSCALVEDPATGSLAAGLAHWFRSTGLSGRSVVSMSQGTMLGRSAAIQVLQGARGEMLVAGSTRTLIDGSISF